MQSDFKHIDKQGIAEPEAPNFTFEKSELPIWKYQSTSVQQQIQNAALFPVPFCKVREGETKISIYHMPANSIPNIMTRLQPLIVPGSSSAAASGIQAFPLSTHKHPHRPDTPGSLSEATFN